MRIVKFISNFIKQSLAIFDLISIPFKIKFGIYSKIRKMIKKKDVQGLIKALRYKEDYGIRRDAAEVLGDIGDVQALDALIHALNDEDSSVRYFAAGALEKIGDTRAIDPLINTLIYEYSRFSRLCIARSLEKLLNIQEAKPLIKTMIDNEDIEERAATGIELRKILSNSPKL